MKYALVIFDMDGTLTEELLDFPAIRRDIGLPPDGGILERIAELPPEQQARADAILDRHEMAAAEGCRLREGAAEILAEITRHNIKTALLTRNSAACARRILDRHRLTFTHIATREDIPHKPHAGSILNITHQLAIPPSRTLMVGDYLYDLQAARAAGADSALLQIGDPERWKKFSHLATYRIASLGELAGILETGYAASKILK